jgi:hypothetical protein
MPTHADRYYFYSYFPLLRMGWRAKTFKTSGSPEAARLLRSSDRGHAQTLTKS